MRERVRLPMVALFSRLDAETAAFAVASGLRCAAEASAEPAAEAGAGSA